jgi:hypothetical protein
MIKFRQMGYLKIEDIRRYGLLTRLCSQNVFAETRFRFLIEWDPTALTQAADKNNVCSPLHHAAHSSIRGFQKVFEYGLLYYPTKKGISLLFKKDNFNRTPFQNACGRFGRDKGMNVIDETLLDFQRRRSDVDSNTGPYNTVDALVVAAFVGRIHLDCVYFL